MTVRGGHECTIAVLDTACALCVLGEPWFKKWNEGGGQVVQEQKEQAEKRMLAAEIAAAARRAEAARLKAAADRAEAARKVKLPVISDSAPSADTHSSLTCSGPNRPKIAAKS